MNSSVFWDITPCSPLNVNRRFGGICRPYLFLGLFFDPEDEGEIFPRKLLWLSADYTTLYGARDSAVG
jgi:hypothetical protein